MDSRVSRDQEVDIKELSYGILKEWRWLLGVGCACAVALGGYKAQRSLAGQMSPEYGAVKEAEYQEALLAYEDEKRELEREIETIGRGLDARQEYVDHSVLMQMDPCEEGVAAAKLYVKIDGWRLRQSPGADYGDVLVQAYASSFKEDDLLRQAVKEEEAELRYVKELIEVETDRDSRTLTVTVVHQDELSAKALLDGLLSAMKGKETWLGRTIGENELVTVSQTSDLVADQALKERQEAEAAWRTQMQESLKTKKAELAALAPPESVDALKRAAVRQGLRYGLFGGVLGIFFAGFLAALRWLGCDRAGAASEVEKRFGIPELGCFGKEKKGVFRRLDIILERLFGIEQALEDEQVYQMIETRIRTYHPEAARIYVAGPGPDTCKGKLAVRLRKAFPDREVHMGGSVHADPEALKGAAESDGVILVAEKDKSTYQEIRREALAVESCRSRVLGCVLV